jgi:hypothetical protein
MSMRLADWKGRHRGCTAMVVGCGPSARSYDASKYSFVGIGVNDAARFADFDYLVLVDPRQCFTTACPERDRWRYIEGFKGPLFRNADHVGKPKDQKWGVRDEHTLFRCRSGKNWDLIDSCLDGSGDCENALYLHFTSPQAAICLAYRMGCTRVGMVGVDFVGHPLASNLAKLNLAFREIHARLGARGVELWNCSAESALTTVPKCSIDELAEKGGVPWTGGASTNTGKPSTGSDSARDGEATQG